MDGGSRHVPRWLVVFLLLNVAEDFSIGISGLAFGTRILVPLHGLTPLNARFIASLYAAGGIAVLLTAFSRTTADARVVVIAFEAIVVLVLAMTFVYWDDFTEDGAPIGWLFTYTVDPIVGAFAIARLGLWRPAAPGRHALSALFAVAAAGFLVLGLAFVIDPHAVARVWPWKITPLLGRVYGSFFCAFGIGCLVATAERRASALRAFTIGTLSLFVLSGAVTIYHHSRFHASAQTTAWLCVHAVALLAFIAALALLRRPERELIPTAA
jgi:hypothetical protein